jgi:8-oxo-dGTP diphosphatase
MITQIRRFLGVETDEEKLLRFRELEKSLSDVDKRIDLLADDFSDRYREKTLVMKSDQPEFVKAKVNEKFEEFLKSQRELVVEVKKEKEAIRKQLDPLLKIKSFVKILEDEKNYSIVKGSYKEGVINSDVFDKFYKAKQGKVFYADNLVFNEEGKLLLLKRSKTDKTQPDTWVIPGGHVDLGEEFEDAAKRELQEESGLNADQVTLVGEYSNNEVQIKYYRSTVNSQEQPVILQESEMQDYVWIDPNIELCDYEFPFNMKDNIKKILKIKDSPNVVIVKAIESGLIDKNKFIEILKAKAQVGEVRHWQGGDFKKTAQGEWVKVVGSKEKPVASSGVIKNIKNELSDLWDKYSKQRVEFEKSLETKFPKGSIAYKVFFDRAWSQELDNNDFLKKIREEQKDLQEEINEISKKAEIDKKRSRESKVGKKEIDFNDLEEQFKEFRGLFESVNKEIPRTATADKVAPNVTVDDYFLNTETVFKSFFEYDYNRKYIDDENGIRHTDNVLEKWKEMKDSGRFEFTPSPKSSSQYLIDRENEDIYRLSDHWGRCASCYWGESFKNGSYGIGVSNIKDFKRKDSGIWFNPQYRTKMVEAAEVVLPKLNDLVSEQKDFYLTDKAKERVINFSNKIFDNYLKSSALMAEEELVALRKKYTDLFEMDPNNKAVIQKALKDGIIDKEKFFEIMKSKVHKYTKKTPDGKGGFNYEYPEDKKGDKKEGNEIKNLYINSVKETKDGEEDKKKDNTNRIKDLPKGKIFDDAKSLEGVFKKSNKSWSEVIEFFEKNRDNAKVEEVSLKDIHITQPNIQSNKVEKMINDIDKTPTIDAVQFKDGEISIFDGHHRLASLWSLGKEKIKVNLVKEDQEKKDGGEKKEENKHVEKFRQLSDDQIKFYLDAPYPEVKEAAKMVADERGLSVVSKEDYIKQFEDYSYKDNKERKLFYREDSEAVKEYLDSNKEIENSLNLYVGSDEHVKFRRLLTSDFKDSNSKMEVKKIKKASEDISKFISENKIKQDILLNRMVSSKAFFSSLDEGDVYEDKSFSSTALDIPETKADFRIQILAKKGSSVANVNNPTELEYLIDKGAKFRVLKKEQGGITVELL